MSWLSKWLARDAAPAQIAAKDAVAPVGILGRMASGVYNYMTGAGLPQDKASAWRFGAYSLDRAELEGMVSNAAYQRVCSRRPEAALATVPTLTGEDADLVLAVTEHAKALNLWGIGALAGGQALRDGVSALVLITDTRQAREPLDAANEKLLRLELFSRWEMTPRGWIEDLTDPRFGTPEVVELAVKVGSRTVSWTVHGSRVVLFRGPRPIKVNTPQTTVGDGWDDYGVPLAHGLQASLRLMGIHQQQIGRLLASMNSDVFKMSNLLLDGSLSEEGRLTLAGTLREIRDRSSSAAVTALAPGEDMMRLEAKTTGVGELGVAVIDHLALGTGDAKTTLVGEPPPGLGDGGKGARLTFGQQVAAYASAYLLAPLSEIVGHLAAWNGGEPGDVAIVFADPVPSTALEAATLRETHARTDAMLIAAAVLTANEARQRYVAGGEPAAELPPLEGEPEAAPGALLSALLEQPAAPAPVADASPTAALIALTLTPESQAVVADLREGLPNPETWPHVSLLYLGDIPASRQAELRRKAAALMTTLADDVPLDLEVLDVGTFPEGDDGVPVVLRLRARGLRGVHDRLLRALAPQIRVEQYPRFLPHVTLGYAPEAPELPTAPTAPLRAAALILRIGDQDVFTVALE